MHDSFTALGGMIPLINMQLGEIIVGGVGAGLYGMLLFVILAIFVAGLMVGRTPEYVGKKIEVREVKMAMLAVLVLPLMYLGWTAVAMEVPSAVSAMGNPGPHGFTEVLYAYVSQDGNNGSAFAGLSANTLFYNLSGAIAMFVGRFWMIIPTTAIAGSLAAKKSIPASIERMRDIHAFVHVAEAKSFTAAAERIGLSRSAVGKSVLRLEDRLGVRLLQRTTRSVSLTGEGAVFLERCIRVLADLDEAEMSMLSHSQTPRGPSYEWTVQASGGLASQIRSRSGQYASSADAGWWGRRGRAVVDILGRTKPACRGEHYHRCSDAGRYSILVCGTRSCDARGAGGRHDRDVDRGDRSRFGDTNVRRVLLGAATERAPHSSFGSKSSER
jgi:molybdenum-dependent DNA-binding transcriptional regulator ModE